MTNETPTAPAVFHLSPEVAAAIASGSIDPAAPAALASLRVRLASGVLARLTWDGADGLNLESLDASGRVLVSVPLWLCGETLADALADADAMLGDPFSFVSFDSQAEDRLARAAVPPLAAYFASLQPPTA